MCGRFEFNLSDPYMQSVFKDLQGRHNYELLHSGEIFPTDSVPALVMKNGKPVFLSGFYKKQSDKKAFIILTKEATAPVSRFHNRIPILIDEANIEDWLGDIDFAFYYVQTDYPSALVFHS